MCTSACRRAESRHGKRLNPRKADLHRWRETFAEKLRDQGIEAEVTRQALWLRSTGQFTRRATQLLASLEHAGLSVQPEALRQSLARLEMPFVLTRVGQQFRYQVPLQCAQILEEDTEYLLRSEIKSITST